MNAAHKILISRAFCFVLLTAFNSQADAQLQKARKPVPDVGDRSAFAGRSDWPQIWEAFAKDVHEPSIPGRGTTLCRLNAVSGALPKIDPPLNGDAPTLRINVVPGPTVAYRDAVDAVEFAASSYLDRISLLDNEHGRVKRMSCQHLVLTDRVKLLTAYLDKGGAWPALGGVLPLLSISQPGALSKEFAWGAAYAELAFGLSVSTRRPVGLDRSACDVPMTLHAKLSEAFVRQAKCRDSLGASGNRSITVANLRAQRSCEALTNKVVEAEGTCIDAALRGTGYSDDEELKGLPYVNETREARNALRTQPNQIVQSLSEFKTRVDAIAPLLSVAEAMYAQKRDERVQFGEQVRDYLVVTLRQESATLQSELDRTRQERIRIAAMNQSLRDRTAEQTGLIAEVTVLRSKVADLEGLKAKAQSESDTAISALQTAGNRVASALPNSFRSVECGNCTAQELLAKQENGYAATNDSQKKIQGLRQSMDATLDRVTRLFELQKQLMEASLKQAYTTARIGQLTAAIAILTNDIADSTAKVEGDEQNWRVLDAGHRNSTARWAKALNYWNGRRIAYGDACAPSQTLSRERFAVGLNILSSELK